MGVIITLLILLNLFFFALKQYSKAYAYAFFTTGDEGDDALNFELENGVLTVKDIHEAPKEVLEN